LTRTKVLTCRRSKCQWAKVGSKFENEEKVYELRNLASFEEIWEFLDQK